MKPDQVLGGRPRIHTHTELGPVAGEASPGNSSRRRTLRRRIASPFLMLGNHPSQDGLKGSKKENYVLSISTYIHIYIYIYIYIWRGRSGGPEKNNNLLDSWTHWGRGGGGEGGGGGHAQIAGEIEPSGTLAMGHETGVRRT